MAAKTLTPQMRSALRAAIIRPGRLTDTYDGKTVRALQRRDLVRLDTVDVAGIKRDAVYPTLAAYQAIPTVGLNDDA